MDTNIDMTEVKSQPKISVIIPVYNAEQFLRESIDSILNQTFSDFELIIIDDGSTDNSAVIIKSYDDSRIKFIQNEKNLGIARTLNRGLALACGEYIARMDADDISLPERFAEQVLFMDKHQNAGICGTFVKIIGDDHEYVWKYETEPQKMKARLLFVCSLANPTVMIRRSLMVKHHLIYDENVVAEDYDLWVRAAEFFDSYNLPKVLLWYRVHQKNNTKHVINEVKNSALEINRKLITQLGITPTEDDLMIHNLSCTYTAPISPEFIGKAAAWFAKLQEANTAKKIYSQEALASVIGLYWYGLLVRSIGQGNWVLKSYRHSQITKNLTVTQKMKFALKYFYQQVRTIF